MFDERTLKQVREGMVEWWGRVQQATGDAQEERRFSTVSDLEIKRI